MLMSSVDLQKGLAMAGREHADQDPERPLWSALAGASTPETFCRAWLALQCRMIFGVTGGMLLLGPPDSGPYRPIAVWPDARCDLTHLTSAAERALTERRGLLLKGDPAVPNPASARERYQIAYPVQVRERLRGVVVLEVTARSEPQLQAALRQLYWGAMGVERLLSQEEILQETDGRERLQTVLDLLATAMGQEAFAATTLAFVTAVATRLQCDRVSLGFRRRGRTRLQAVSHSANFKERSNQLRAIAEAMDEAIDQRTVITLPVLPETPVCVTRAHEAQARLHGAGAICTVPLAAGGQLIGALSLERSTDRPFDARTVDLLGALAALAGPVLEAQRREDRWLLTIAGEGIWRQVERLLGPRRVASQFGILSLAGLVTCFALAKGDYRISAKGVLEPLLKQAAVAPFNGYIREAPLRAGDLVGQGMLLAALDDRDLRLERLKWVAQQEELLKQYRQAMAERKAAQVEIFAAQLKQANAQIALLDEQLQRTVVRAPFDGVIVSGDLSQSLGAPVERGAVLFEVAPFQDFRLVLEVDEHDIADVRPAQRGAVIFSAFPTGSFPFVVETITPVSTAREGRNYFRVEGRLEWTDDRLRPGMEGVGKIEVERRLLVWIWTHDVIDSIRLTLWAWLP